MCLVPAPRADREASRRQERAKNTKSRARGEGGAGSGGRGGGDKRCGAALPHGDGSRGTTQLLLPREYLGEYEVELTVRCAARALSRRPPARASSALPLTSRPPVPRRRSVQRDG